VAALAAAGPCAAADDPPWRLSDYTREVWRLTDGLPQDSITGIVQTPDGYLWVSTLDGIARFDGVRFDTYNLIRVAGLGSNVVTAMVHAPGGGLLLGTSEGLVRYADGRFAALGPDPRLRSVAVRALRVGRDGAIWIGTRWNGLLRLAGGRLTAFTTADGLADNDVRAIEEDRDGAIWVGSTAGLDRLVAGRFERVPLPPDPPPAPVTALHVDGAGTVWIGTTNALWALDPGARAGWRMRHVTAKWGVRTLAEGPADGVLWVGTGGGLGRVTGDRVEVTTVEDLTFNNVRSLATDHEGSLWIGTDGGGLNRFRKASVIMRAPGGATVGRPVMPVYRAPDNAMWTGAHCGGLTRWVGDQTTTFTKRDGLPDDCIRALAGDGRGTVWIGTGAGLARFADGRLTAFTTRDGLSDPRVYAIAVARSGEVWIGTGGHGVDRFDGRRFTNLSTANGLAFDDVRALLEARDGSMWIGTLGGGLSRWHDGVLTRLSRDEGLSSNHVLALMEDPDGTLWVGTNGGGLNRIRNGRVVAYGTHNGLFSDGVFVVLDDGRGSLWMGCNRGVFRVSRRDLDAVADGTAARVRSEWFGRAEGLRPAGVLGGSQSPGAVDAAGRLWFPTLEGVAIIDPSRLTRNDAVPPVLIQRIRSDGHEVSPDAWLSIPPGRRSIEIDYTAFSLIAPSKVGFRYRLEGPSDSGWVDAGTRRTAFFTNLGAGHYRFHVTASNNDGIWNPAGAVAEFVLQPRIYETRTFLLVCALALLITGWGGLRFRERRLRARQAELSRQVEDAMAQVKVLSGLLPLCSWCRRIRDTDERWTSIEDYVHEHSEATFTHGVCPDCARRHFPGVMDP